MQLHEFRALTFDVYGTLIDWETGMLTLLRPWARRHRLDLDDDTLLAAFGEIEHRWQLEHPAMPYDALLTEVHQDLARQLGALPDREAARAFGRSVPDWPAFDDTPAALATLARHYRLCILSNVDNRSLAGTLPRLGVDFHAIYTAQDIGSYKPARANFDYAMRRLLADGVQRHQVLHVAQSLFHDHEPAAALGIASCWIDRREGRRGQGAVKPPMGEPRPAFRFASLADFAAAVQREAAAA
jgi:2-haloalkanoic acid dehalogenase type II